ncbi:MAG: DNA polymerase III subunit beta [Tannerella sp.]|jgi:DNA polymerase-3 subunit beta|nr:DNA polymerase III subunit beta [Tannerella sp.]
MKNKTEIRISRNSLLGTLLKAARVASNKSFILFEVKGGILTVKANNHETQIEASVNPDGQPSDVAFCMDDSIISMLKLLPEQPLAITVTEEKEEKITRINVRIVHDSGTANFPAFPAGEYAEIKHGDGEAFSIPAKKLKMGLGKTRKFTDKNELRPVMMAVYLDITQDGITFVGTDTYAMSVFKDKSLTGISARGIIINTDAVNDIVALLDNSDSDMAVISSGDKVITVAFGDTVISIRAIEGRYPNYNSIIPANNTIRCTLDSEGVSAAANRILTVSDLLYKEIRIAVADGEVRLSGGNEGLSRRAEEKMPAQCEGSIEIKTRITHLKAAMSIITGNAVLSFSDPARPVLISPEINEEDTELLVLVMPVK